MVWKFKLKEDHVFLVPKQFQKTFFFHELKFYDKKENEWLILTRNTIETKKGYSWDGCSPCIKIWGRFFGTPDTKKTYEASLVHDLLCQFEKHEHMPYSRKDMDDIFHWILEREKFWLADVYYAAVRAYSIILRK